MTDEEKYEITDKGTVGAFGWFFGILLILFLLGTYFVLFHLMP